MNRFRPSAMIPSAPSAPLSRHEVREELKLFAVQSMQNSLESMRMELLDDLVKILDSRQDRSLSHGRRRSLPRAMVALKGFDFPSEVENTRSATKKKKGQDGFSSECDGGPQSKNGPIEKVEGPEGFVSEYDVPCVSEHGDDKDGRMYIRDSIASSRTLQLRVPEDSVEDDCASAPLIVAQERFASDINLNAPRMVLVKSFCEECRAATKHMLESILFENMVGVIVIANAMLLGYETDCKLAKRAPHPWSITFDAGFFLFFCCELLLRLCVYGSVFFSMQGWAWNIFDFFLVTVQSIDIASHLLLVGRGWQMNLTIVRTLRVLRFVRITRILRALRLFRDLRLIIASTTAALGSFAWALVLQLMALYVFGVMFSQIVSSSDKFESDDFHELRYWFGSLSRSMITMLECVLGGVSWDTILHPLLTEFSAGVPCLFIFYISMSYLAMMSLATGLFVAEVNAKVQEDSREATKQNISELFNALTTNGSDIERTIFMDNLEHPLMLKFLKMLDVHPCEASLLFDLLDEDGGGSLDKDELVNGFMRFRGSARALEMCILRREVGDIMDKLDDLNQNKSS
eukprot:TRINITY_DN57_c0_g1_i1.p1 TRINITY_DN57_c0_g1~~TRINITY_DN57_c0_g1_i1.p1  ORF type:complete len:574 (+),score=74.33 TRINITY_DN57_c0_g1_i1:74-1795(+)